MGANSFSGDTELLMADGTTEPISEIRVGDEVLATDPETGEKRIETVKRVFIHEDTVIDLHVDGEVITTTEDHPFWSVTDHRFEDAQHLAPGEHVLTASGRTLRVNGLRPATSRTRLAYNLEITNIHTYHVGELGVLVHNDCGPYLAKQQGARMTTPQATELAEWLGFTRVKGHHPHGQAVYTDGRVFISPDVDGHSLGAWKMASTVNGFGPKQRLGTFDFLLNRIAK